MLFGLLVYCGFASRGAAVEKQDLFAAGEGGYALYRIPGIIVTKDGTVLAYCEARKRGGDWGRIDIFLRRSFDGGRNWSEPRGIVIVEGDLPMNPLAAAQNLDKPGDNTANNPVAIAGENGTTHFLYCLEYMRVFYMRSEDDGATWSDPVEITSAMENFRKVYDWKVIATGPGHGIELHRGKKKGRLVVPVWLSTGTGGHAHRPSVAATIYSDDGGQQWHCGEIAVPNTEEFINPNETAVVELTDGRVLLNSRNESRQHRRIVTTSEDGATEWSVPQFEDELLEPICMAGLARVSLPEEGKGRSRIVFSNPHNLARVDGREAPGRGRDRRNLAVKLSYDEGRSWPIHRVLEPHGSGYSDLAALKDGTVLCFYERGPEENPESSTGRLTLARIPLRWLEASAHEDHSTQSSTR